LLGEAGISMKAMILLGRNGGFSNCKALGVPMESLINEPGAKPKKKRKKGKGGYPMTRQHSLLSAFLLSAWLRLSNRAW
jgi:hypothetical protein